MYAIIQLQGQQYKVEKGSKLILNRMSFEEGKEESTDQVLMIVDDKKTVLGEPMVKKAVVTFKVLQHSRAKKIIVLKFKRRKHHMKRQGHRQDQTQIEITDIKVG